MHGSTPDPRGRFPSPGEYPVHGIDVSHHQGTIDWDRVAAEGSEPGPAAYGDWQIWQYSGNSRLPGITGLVDRNVLHPAPRQAAPP